MAGYTYYPDGRVKSLKQVDYREALFYDRAGNRIKRVVKERGEGQAGVLPKNPLKTVEETCFYDRRNRLTRRRTKGGSEYYTYDEAGNLLRDGRASYTYDGFNRTSKVETFSGEIQINRYDGEGLRAELEENVKLVQFIYRDREIIVEEKAEGQVRYLRTDRLLASDAEYAGTWYHYASDELGSITHVEEGGEILNRYEYDAWGNLTACEEQAENRFTFTGQQTDPISGQYYLRARYYNPVIGRFIQEDTYYEDGLNLYAYCRNNPVNYADLGGNFCEKAAERIGNLIDQGRIKGQNRSKLEGYLRENAGTLTDAEKRVARKLGVDVESGSESSIMDYSNRFADSLADDFNHGVEVRDVVKEDMILVQFSSDAPNASLRYWTTIDEANGISTIEEYMDKMALSKEWGNRNVVKVARVKKGTEVTHAIGTAKAQTKISDPRPGNGKQILFSKFDSNWITEVRNIKE